MAAEHYADLKVLLMRRDGEQHLRIVVEAVGILREFGLSVKGEVELGVNTLYIGVDAWVPAERNTVEVVAYLFSPQHVKHTSIHNQVVLSLSDNEQRICYLESNRQALAVPNKLE